MIYEHEINIFNEDALKNKFSTIDTQFNVTLGKISAIISDSEIEQYIDGHTTMNTRLSSVVQDLDGVHTQVSSMQTEYRNGFTQVDSRLSQLDVTINGITANVSSVTDRVSAAELKITDSAIISTVMETTDGQDALVSAIEQTSEKIHFAAKYLSWNSTYSSMTEDGLMTVIGMTAKSDYFEESGARAESTLGTMEMPSYGSYTDTGRTISFGKVGGSFVKYYRNGKLRQVNAQSLVNNSVGYPQDLVVTTLSGYCRGILQLPSNTDVQSSLSDYSSYYGFSEQFASGSYSISALNKTSGQVADTTTFSMSSAEFWVRGSNSGGSSYQMNLTTSASYVLATIELKVTTISGLVSHAYVSPNTVEMCNYNNAGFSVTTNGDFWIGHKTANTVPRLYGTNTRLYYMGNTVTTSSSKRYKHDIRLMTNLEFNPHNLLNLVPKQFVYNDGEEQYQDTKGMTIPGFIAEDVAEIYPSAVIHNQKGEIESWDERRIIPGMLALIQELYQKVTRLEGKGAII